MSSPPPPQSATTLTLTTYELLERILLHLDIHTLYTLHRVSKSWSSLLTRSLPLREKMYLASPTPPITPIQSLYASYSGRTRTIYAPVPMTLNPCGEVLGLYNQPSGRGHRIPLLTFGISDQNVFLQFEIKGFPVWDKDLLREGTRASWRKMFVTQPPITAVNFECIRRDPWGGSVTVWNPKGVTLGDLQEVCEEMRRMELDDGGMRCESLGFCLLHPFTEDRMEEAW